jgi:UDP-N-acetylglucosamine--N-acetylmuramyl-(pentapeptide) pyrophosphoryl-undecaprenol N-acetylglucosamine transferase
MNVLITGGGSGGHVSPALAVIEALRERVPEVRLLYVGGMMRPDGSTAPPIEQQLVAPLGIPYIAIQAGKLTRGSFSWHTLRRLWGVIPGLLQALRVVYRFRPDVIFSTGGYVSLPVVVAGFVLRVPIIIHEQTAAVGLANRLASKMATVVAITFPESRRYFPRNNVIVTGNPLRREILQPVKMAKGALSTWLDSGSMPVIYVTGGGLGAHRINRVVGETLKQLLGCARVIHQCGNQPADERWLEQQKSALPETLRDRYWLAQAYSSQEVGAIYGRASLVVARAGANTVLELGAWGLPALFIPLPQATHDEQTRNAQYLVAAGTAHILPEARLTAAHFMAEIDEFLSNLDRFGQHADAAKKIVRLDAAQRLVDVLVSETQRGNS